MDCPHNTSETSMEKSATHKYVHSCTAVNVSKNWAECCHGEMAIAVHHEDDSVSMFYALMSRVNGDIFSDAVSNRHQFFNFFKSSAMSESIR